MHKVFTVFTGGKKLIPVEQIIPRYGASGIVIDGTRILLIGLKDSEKLWFPGGTIEEGESPQEAVRREVREETGIDVEVGDLVTEVQNNFYYDPLDRAWEQNDKFYLCQALSTEIPEFNNPDSIDEAGAPRWIEIATIQPEQMQDYGFEVIKLVLEMFE